jgi:predicted AAA+ superfamily ATPase
MPLKPWREVVKPHPDVASGRFRQAEFAADLAQVLKGEGGAEYRDPVEFFRRTYLTTGMRQLLSNALRRLTGDAGDPVVQLKTAFGGGKTHTMLGLYHLLAPDKRVEDLDVTQTLLSDAGLEERPGAAVAVLVGTDIDANRGREAPELSTTIYTLWGWMAYQLGKTSKLGPAAAWRFVEDNDAMASAPGGETMKALFNAVGPCVILIDELIAYIRNLKGTRVRGGTFDSNLTFVQNLTEAARATPHAMLVASLPQSDIEVGGTAGQEALQKIENTFRRVQAAAYPVEPRESFEIVRRRLFDDVGEPDDRDGVCAAFAKLYRDHRTDFLSKTWEADYERRLLGSYPIHPQIFDELYEEWSANERFQRTRGVLRLMATAIHSLWKSQDPGLMIMPGSLPMAEPAVRSEILSYLGEEWNAVIDSDVDSDHAEPARIDSENPRFGQHRAATRVARTILLGSPPWKATKGLEMNEILLGVVEPRQSLSEYSDALGRLRDRLAFLYTTGSGRYWFAAQPNLKRTWMDRKDRITEERALEELVKRLRDSREKGEFASVHWCPDGSADVPDDNATRLVVVSPRFPHSKEDSKALEFAKETLEKRGAAPRRYKNMLVFAAASSDDVLTLIEDARRWMAWKSVEEDADALNLDKTQRTEVKNELEKAERDLSARLDPAYQWLLVPEQEGTEPISWRITKFASNQIDAIGSLPVRASNNLIKDELLLIRWSPASLHLELERYVWKDGREDIKVRDLWELLATYVYLPRLRDANTLLEAIKDGTATRDYFGYATSKTAEGGYAGLAFGRRASNVFLDDLGVIVRADVAAKAAGVEELGETPKPKPGTAAGGVITDGGGTATETPPKRFYGTIKLNPQRLATAAGQVGEEVLQHLAGLVDSDVEVLLEITVKVPEGIPDRVVRTVSENANTLKFEHFEFEPE